MPVKFFDLGGLSLELSGDVEVHGDQMILSFNNTRGMDFQKELQGYGMFLTVDDVSRPFAIGVERDGLRYGFVYHNIQTQAQRVRAEGRCFLLKYQQMLDGIEDLERAVRLLRKSRHPRELAYVRETLEALEGVMQDDG